MHLQQHLHTAVKLVSTYDGLLPFAAFLKNYFKVHKKHGSTDRRHITALCYSYFRLGKAAAATTVEEKLLMGQLLTGEAANVFINQLKPEWKEMLSAGAKEKIQFLQVNEPFFPFLDEVSDDIDKSSLNLSCLTQPDLFLRLRPQSIQKVVQSMQTAGIPFTIENQEAIRLANSTKLDGVVNLDSEAVVQDLSSQQVLNSFFQEWKNHGAPLKVWDCCAASGGKSILLLDHFPHAVLTATDIRESILANLEKRFRRAGIENYFSFAADVAKPGYKLPRLRGSRQAFDLIICDAPCSGSGTWFRTPEQLSFFKHDKIEEYAALQKAIALNTIQALKKDSYLLYITCSVFQKENEEVVQHLQEKAGLKLLSSHYIKGYASKADTLFAALLKS